MTYNGMVDCLLFLLVRTTVTKVSPPESLATLYVTSSSLRETIDCGPPHGVGPQSQQELQTTVGLCLVQQAYQDYRLCQMHQVGTCLKFHYCPNDHVQIAPRCDAVEY